MSLSADKSVLVVGIGNPLRCDDGVGPYVADCIEAKAIKGIKVWVTQQLYVEDLEPMLAFSKVILVDAAVGGQDIDFHTVKLDKLKGIASSHHLSAETFVSLARSIYSKNIDMQVCSIRGLSFEAGDKISASVLTCAQRAVELICSSL